ncbi:hypothetical protein EW145_g1705 [Phellinidium pouzarii]|uniref:Uncharacterized protein n=1 Tax=Phellinidium pouzarii TaxID=167371 RepID=A0A4S4LDZ1_9AGAM|nr:hypothetical protein EW145_g1705 [Phellinidium pouzarii]
MSNEIELAKQRYSDALAAYTFEQWRIARSAQRARQDAAIGGSGSADDDRTPHPPERDSSPTPSEINLLAIDFAKKMPKVNGVL